LLRSLLAKTSEVKMKSSNEVFYFLAGVSVGIIAALLVTPYTGEETRQYIRERVDEGRERAEDMLEKGKEYVGSRRGSVSNVLGYGSKNYQEKI
jgi:gas vesicle protein